MYDKSHPAGGVKVFSIGGRLTDVRERCLGMTDVERKWRAQFLQDQILEDHEPRNVPEFYKDTTNFFRRLWKTPMWKFQTALENSLGKGLAYGVRHYIGKTAASIAVLYGVVYYLKYNSNDWTKTYGWSYYLSRPRMFPDDPNYPNYHQKSPREYFDPKFYSSSLGEYTLTHLPQIKNKMIATKKRVSKTNEIEGEKECVLKPVEKRA